jgi:hypothetical protein
MEIWQNKIRALRKYLRGWANNINGAYKKEKKEIISKLDELDKKKPKAQCWHHMKWIYDIV